jgi:hypothetical protein
MAVATITSNSFGFKATGGVDETSVTSARVEVDRLVVKSGSAAAGSVTLKDATGSEIGIFNSATASRSTVYDLGGMLVDGPKVTLSATDVIAVLKVK